jgi:hypothetical protein
MDGQANQSGTTTPLATWYNISPWTGMAIRFVAAASISFSPCDLVQDRPMDGQGTQIWGRITPWTAILNFFQLPFKGEEERKCVFPLTKLRSSGVLTSLQKKKKKERRTQSF